VPFKLRNPLKKVKGGGTKKVCLPAAKVSKSFVKGARKKGATLRDWFQKENWVQVGNPKKKCGEK
jgi:hypothetical protein